MIETLTERQIEVLGLVIAGWSNIYIAQKLNIATHTVERHMENIYFRLEIPSSKLIHKRIVLTRQWLLHKKEMSCK